MYLLYMYNTFFYLYKWLFVFLLRIAVTGYMYGHVKYKCTVVAFKTYFIIILLLCSILKILCDQAERRTFNFKYIFLNDCVSQTHNFSQCKNVYLFSLYCQKMFSQESVLKIDFPYYLRETYLHLALCETSLAHPLISL